MKEYTITEEQIRQLAKGNKKVEKMFPDVFETKIEAGKWYKTNHTNKKTLIFVTNKDLGFNCGYGFDFEGNWIKQAQLNSDWDARLATEEEVEEALIKEAEKRGFKPDRYFIPIFRDGNPQPHKVIFRDKDFFMFDVMKNSLDILGAMLFVNGIWAELVEEKYYTKEQAERRLSELQDDGFIHKIID